MGIRFSKSFICWKFHADLVMKSGKMFQNSYKKNYADVCRKLYLNGLPHFKSKAKSLTGNKKTIRSINKLEAVLQK